MSNYSKRCSPRCRFFPLRVVPHWRVWQSNSWKFIHSLKYLQGLLQIKVMNKSLVKEGLRKKRIACCNVAEISVLFLGTLVPQKCSFKAKRTDSNPTRAGVLLDCQWLSSALSPLVQACCLQNINNIISLLTSTLSVYLLYYRALLVK